METELGTKRGDIRVVIGPGIGACCYTVAKERALLFASTFGATAMREEKSAYVLDMQQANLSLLAQEGIEDITICTDCTSCNHYLSSYRRDGKPDFTAMLAGISFKNILREKHPR
jgi:copper oxidase (laccase) domain-containing protein